MKRNEYYNPETDTLYKRKKTDKVYWVDYNGRYFGIKVFTFDKKTFFNFYADYPEKLTPEQKKIFDEENELLVNYHGDFSEFNVEGGLDAWVDLDIWRR